MKSDSLTSPKNPLLRDIRKAVARGGLTEDGYAVAETFHLLEEAIRSKSKIKCVLVAESAARELERFAHLLRHISIHPLPDSLFRDISATETSQGVMTLAKPPAWELEALFRSPALVIVLDRIQDPGNAGAVLRASEAFGASGVVYLKGTVNPYNPKAVRASAGSIFRQRLVAGVEDEAVIEALRKRNVRVFTAVPTGAATLDESDLTQDCALVIGSEGHGVSERLRAIATDVTIPMEQVESLNAAMAAGILLYEARRQRRNR
jgi:TrmH family RNA methyltransferase